MILNPFSEYFWVASKIEVNIYNVSWHILVYHFRTSLELMGVSLCACSFLLKSNTWINYTKIECIDFKQILKKTFICQVVRIFSQTKDLRVSGLIPKPIDLLIKFSIFCNGLLIVFACIIFSKAFDFILDGNHFLVLNRAEKRPWIRFKLFLSTPN
ncbi:hypothetical protein KUTeg_001882 [Tegillarca granosa]|uniref:Uncharacterized protein n=1 Tax=Tegillarca granosa TaxID=220873 RepID=A0ABQ9FX33_TEGGR|nr:hypothetical protein KUTeg_001882 [Tegillarca granosa]